MSTDTHREIGDLAATRLCGIERRRSVSDRTSTIRCDNKRKQPVPDRNATQTSGHERKAAINDGHHISTFGPDSEWPTGCETMNSDRRVIYVTPSIETFGRWHDAQIAVGRLLQHGRVYRESGRPS
jgi:hypothetical protein